MKNKKFFARSAAAVMIVLILLCSLTLTAYAAPDSGDNGGNTVIDNPDPVDTPDPIDDGGQTDDPPADDPADNNYTDPTDPPADSGDGGNGYDEVIDDVTEPIAETQNVDDLPYIDSAEVIEATAVVLPDVEISDASLFSGLVMWMCVAVGIAVVVGVMVSKRTHRRGL